MSEPVSRPVASVIEAIETMEGGGFPVRRPFPTQMLPHVDPFLLLDEMGPVDWKPNEAIGAPDHPHRGFEIISYCLSGKIGHSDTLGTKSDVGPGGTSDHSKRLWHLSP